MNASAPRATLAGLHDETYRWALFCCGFDADRASEVLQTVYVEVLSGRAKFHGQSAYRTWLFAVVKLTARRLPRRERNLERSTWALADPAGEDEAADADAGHRHAADMETRMLVKRALDRLPARQRAIVELVYYHDTTVAEAAQILGIGTGSAAQHLHRAKRSLAEVLQPLRGNLLHA
jgi:RNA polymerase sigma factor (sigma-70 family)